MILGDVDILAAVDRQEIVIQPLKRENLGTDTYDVSLGEYYYRETREKNDSCVPQIADYPIYNIYDQEHVTRVWGHARRAMRLRDVVDAIDVKLMGQMRGFEPDDRLIWIAPGETILAHTDEFIGGLRNHTTKMYSRSSIGRSLLGVCKCAGRGDVGYINRWTMEITSFSKEHIIPLKVGSRVAQIEFQKVEHHYQSYTSRSGKYQDSEDVAKLMSTWTPDRMLPRLSKDKEIAGQQPVVAIPDRGTGT